MKLSIIIPVYNVADTLKECIASILLDSFKDREIILVDDGSTDESGQICDEYAKKHDFIVVIHQQNQGLSQARNVGISLAKGEYITFVDSDDWIFMNTYQDVFKVLEDVKNIDFIEYSYIQQLPDGKPKPFIFYDRIYTDVADYWLNAKAYTHCYAWNKIYKRTLFEGIRYPAGRRFEDVWLLPSLLQRCHRIAITGKGLYYYAHNTKGITATADGLALQDLLQAHLTALPLWCNASYYAHVLNIQLDVYERLQTPPVLSPKSYLLPYKNLIAHLIGIERLCRLNQWIHKHYRRNR